MKNYILFFLLFISLGAAAQPTSTQYIGTPSTLIHTRGWHRIDSGFVPPRLDTLSAPYMIGEQRTRLADSSIYLAISLTGQKWMRINYKPGASSPVTSVFGRTGDVTAQLSDYVSFYVPLTRTVNGKALSSNITITATDIGLGNVPNVNATLRANHTGTQLSTTISDFTPGVRNLLNAGSGISYNPATGTIAATGTTSVAWGGITGDIANQTDLQNALNLKVPTARTLTINGVAYDLSADRAWTVAATGTLNDLTDVAIATALNNQLLRYNSGTGQWENWTPNFQTTISTTPGTYNSVTVNSGGQVTAGSNIAYLTSESDPVWNAQKGSYLTSAAASTTYQPIGSYELLSNKSTSFTTINNTLYPTTQAVSDFVSSRVSASGVVYVTGNYAVQAGDRYLYLDQVAPTITLPSASSNNGRIITISTADGVATISPSFVYNQNGSAGTVQNAFSTGDYVSDGANWKKVTTSFGVWQQETGQTGVSLITGGYGYGPQNGSYTPSVLRKLVAGSNVSITENAGQVTISSTGAETDPLAILKTGTTNLTGNVIVAGGANTFQLTGTSEVFNVTTTTAGNAAQVQNNGTGNGLFAITNGGLGLIAQSTTATTNTVDEILRVNRISSGTAANGIGAKAAFNIESSTGSTTLAGSLGYKWADVTHASRTSQIDLEGVNNATPENYANFQKGGIVRVNNLADTLATKAYARSVGGAGGGGSGETNTASNLGGGLANWDSKSGVDLRFNTFNATDFDLATNLLSIDATLKSTWNAKQNAISLTTIGTSGAATFDGTTLNIPQYAGGSGSAHTIKDEGIALTQRGTLNFVGTGVTVTDNAVSGATDVTIAGGGGSPTLTNTYVGVGNASNVLSGSSNLTYNGTRLQLGGVGGWVPSFDGGNTFNIGSGFGMYSINPGDGSDAIYSYRSINFHQRDNGPTSQGLTIGVFGDGDALSVRGTSYFSNELRINTTDQGDYKLQVGGNIWTSGLIKATAYGDGTNTGTATYGAAFDVDGNLIEVALGGGGGGSMVYPSAGIPVSTGTAWGTSITDNSANWNTAFGWGNHATAGYLTSFTETDPTAVKLTGAQTVEGTKTFTGRINIKHPSNTTQTYFQFGTSFAEWYSPNRIYAYTDGDLELNSGWPGTDNTKRVILTNYGAGNRTGTATYNLGVTSTGSIIEVPLGGAVSDTRITTGTLAADVSNSTTTLAKVTGLDKTLAVGTYTFQYYVRYQAAATTTGVRFSVNHSGAVAFFIANVKWVDVSATASTAAATQAGVIASGQVVGAFSARAKSTTGWGTTLSVDAANSDMMMIIEGTFEVTTSGNIELWHGSEVAAASTVKAGSSLMVTKVN